MARKDNKGRNLKTGEYQRPDGRYEYRYKDEITGKRNSVYAADLVSLREMEKKINKDMDDLLITDASVKKLTVNTLFERYMATKNIKERTKKNYIRMWDYRIRNTLGNIRVVDFKTSHVRTFFSALSDEGLAHSTIKGLYGLLNPSFELAVEDGIIRKNPVTGTLGDYGAPAKEKEALTLELWEKLLKIVEQSRSEQELLEEEIKDVRDQNSKLQIQVNKSSVEAVDEAQKKQKEAKKKARTIEYQFNKAQEEVKTVKKKTDCEIKKLKNEAKEKETFWMRAYIILVLLTVIKNTVFQKDLFACITVPLRFWYRYIEWLIHPSELNILGEREYFSAGWSWFLRIMAILIFLGLGISSEIFVLRKIEQYRKAWDKYSIWILLISVSSIAVIGDVVRKYFPINLILLLGLINIAAMEIKIYCHNKRELY